MWFSANLKNHTRRRVGCSGLIAVALLLAMPASAEESGYSPYRGLKVFARAISLIETHYVDRVDTARLMQSAIEGMFNALDPHSVFLTPEMYQQMKRETQGEFGGLGIEVEIRDGVLTVVSPIDGTPAARAGIRAGDQILRVDHTSTEGMALEEAVRRMRGPRGTRVSLALRRAGSDAPLTVDVVRDAIKVVSVVTEVLEPGIVYARVRTFQERTGRDVRQALAALHKRSPVRGVVLDLRNNPGGLLEEAVGLADVFLSQGLIVRTLGRADRVIDEIRARRAAIAQGVPLVCLVNGGSASAAEIVAGALQDQKRAVVVGTPTFGKGSVQTVLEIPGGSAIKLTVARYFTPSGRSIQEEGIVPDVLVPQAAPAIQEETGPREADLKGHLVNPQKPADTAPRGGSPIADDDFQLKVALDLLRAAEIFRAPTPR